MTLLGIFLLVALLASASCAVLIARKRSVSPTPEKSPRPTNGTILVCFASQSGFAESIAWKTAGAVQTSGHPVLLAELDAVDFERLEIVERTVFVVSTTGNGEPPDNARLFARRVMRRKARLDNLRYCLLALGDRSYDNFCGFGRRLDRWLREAGARPVEDTVEVDNADAGALADWQRKLATAGFAAAGSDWVTNRYYRWKLAARVLLNKGSPGGEIFHILLKPVDTPPIWTAGDIAEVIPGPAARSFSGDPELAPREYTVASLPSDGRLELVVRKSISENGEPGRGSGWLTERAAMGDLIGVRLRTNRSFHPPPDDRPMILVGNGSGIAGLRGHLKARALAGRQRNWLIFGERSSVNDQLFRKEIEKWREDGLLRRVDLAFSRDQSNKVYVQHRLLEARDEIRQWLHENASIYVCGSRTGMSEGVDAALQEIVGAEELECLTNQRRYRKDVY